MTRVGRSVFAIAAAAIVAAAAATQADAADEALETLQRSTEEVMAVIYDQPQAAGPLSERVRPVLEKYFDIEYTTRQAIGPGWNRFSEEQRQRAVDLFSRLLLRTYVDRFQPTERPKITFGAVTQPTPERREIGSTITYQGQTFNVAYRMRRTPAGWQVYDVIAENVSMVANYRGQFTEILRKGGPDALLQSLEDNLSATP